MNARLVIFAVVAVVLAISWAAVLVIWQFAGMEAQLAPFEPRRWDELTLVAVGTGSAYENPERRGPAIGVASGEHLWLVDAGQGVTEALRDLRIPVSQPQAVFLTSLLPENTVGLDDLIFAGWLVPREQPLRVVGPPGTAELAKGLMEAYAEGRRALGQALGLPPDGAVLDVVEVDGDWSAEIGGVRITAGLQPGPPLPALAWRFEQGRDAWVVSSAAWSTDALVAFAHDATVLVHEAVFVPDPATAEEAGVTTDPERLAREKAFRTSIEDVGELASRAGVDTLVLIRMRPPPLYALQARAVVEQTFRGEILVPDDGDELTP